MIEIGVTKQLLAQMKKERERVMKELKRLPKGDLRITSNGKDRLSVFRQTGTGSDRKRKGIGRQIPLVYKLAHKAYLEEYLDRVETNIRLLERSDPRLRSLDPADILACLPKHFDMLDAARVIDPHAADPASYPNPVYDKSVYPRSAALNTGELSPRAWAELPYCANTKNREHLIHRTAKGVLCRSKSEVAILNSYDNLQLFYHYDEVIEIDGRYLSPDGIIARQDGTLVYHEHAGVQSADYRGSLLEKLFLYAAGKIYLGHNLILTFDAPDGSINMQLIEMVLRDRLKR